MSVLESQQSHVIAVVYHIKCSCPLRGIIAHLSSKPFSETNDRRQTLCVTFAYFLAEWLLTFMSWEWAKQYLTWSLDRCRAIRGLWRHPQKFPPRRKKEEHLLIKEVNEEMRFFLKYYLFYHLPIWEYKTKAVAPPFLEQNSLFSREIYAGIQKLWGKGGLSSIKSGSVSVCLPIEFS